MNMDMLSRVFDILQRVGGMEQINRFMVVVYGAICIFGILNCILGYRILRFWMMIFGFLIGAGAGFGVTYLSGIDDWKIIIGAMVGIGVVLGIVSFLIYRAGIFVLGFGIGVSLSIYLVHPTSSFTFFLCLLIGVGIGVLAMRYAKGVIIIGTSVLGGVLAGFSLAQIGGLAQFPYGVGMAAGIAILGMLIQFAINKDRYEDDDDDKYEDEPEEKTAGRRNSGHYDDDRRDNSRMRRRNSDQDDAPDRRRNSRTREDSDRDEHYTDRRNSSESRRREGNGRNSSNNSGRSNSSDSRRRSSSASDRNRSSRNGGTSDSRRRNQSRNYSYQNRRNTGSSGRSRYEEPEDYDSRSTYDVSDDSKYDRENIFGADNYEDFEKNQQRKRQLDIENMADFDMTEADVNYTRTQKNKRNHEELLKELDLDPDDYDEWEDN